MSLILHISTGLQNGGAETALSRLVTADRRHEHRIVSLTGLGYHGPALREAGFTVDALDMPNGSVTVSGLRRIYRIISDSAPAVVQTWMYHADVIGGVMARLARHKAIVWSVRASDLGATTRSRQLRALLWLSGKLARRVPARIVCNSTTGARVHQNAGYPAEKMQVIPNGFDTAVFAPNETLRSQVRAEWGVPAGTIVLGNVSRWSEFKDHANLAAAIRVLDQKLPGEWMCAFVGQGMTADNQELASLLARNEVSHRIRLCGPRSDIPAIMNALDIHVLSSKSEGYPNVLGEAMSSGTPCVTTDVGDAAEVVGRSGWVVPRMDSSALAAALANAIAAFGDSGAWQTRRSACRERIVRHYSIERIVQEYDVLWEQMGA